MRADLTLAPSPHSSLAQHVYGRHGIAAPVTPQGRDPTPAKLQPQRLTAATLSPPTSPRAPGEVGDLLPHPGQGFRAWEGHCLTAVNALRGQNKAGFRYTTSPLHLLPHLFSLSNCLKRRSGVRRVKEVRCYTHMRKIICSQKVGYNGIRFTHLTSPHLRPVALAVDAPTSRVWARPATPRRGLGSFQTNATRVIRADVSCRFQAARRNICLGCGCWPLSPRLSLNLSAPSNDEPWAGCRAPVGEASALSQPRGEMQ